MLLYCLFNYEIMIWWDWWNRLYEWFVIYWWWLWI